MVYGILFLVSVAYSLGICWLSRACRPALAEHRCWLAVGWVGYVLVALRYLIPKEEWHRVAGALIVALLPYIVVHLVVSFKRQRRLV